MPQYKLDESSGEFRIVEAVDIDTEALPISPGQLIVSKNEESVDISDSEGNIDTYVIHPGNLAYDSSKGERIQVSAEVAGLSEVLNAIKALQEGFINGDYTVISTQTPTLDVSDTYEDLPTGDVAIGTIRVVTGDHPLGEAGLYVYTKNGWQRIVTSDEAVIEGDVINPNTEE